MDITVAYKRECEDIDASDMTAEEKEEAKIELKEDLQNFARHEPRSNYWWEFQKGIK